MQWLVLFSFLKIHLFQLILTSFFKRWFCNELEEEEEDCYPQPQMFIQSSGHPYIELHALLIVVGESLGNGSSSSLRYRLQLYLERTLRQFCEDFKYRVRTKVNF